MLLREWRKSQKLKLVPTAKIFGLALGSLSDLERGLFSPSMGMIVRIEAVTNGQVTAADHVIVWRKAHPTECDEYRAVGRSAAIAFRKAAKSKPRT